MWSEELKEDILENVTVSYNYEDKKLKFIELRAHDGYVLWNLNMGSCYDEDGELRKDLRYYRLFGCPPNMDISNVIALEYQEWMDTVR